MKFQSGETNIICTDLERSKHFYCTILGFAFVEMEDGCARLRNDNQHYLLLPFAQRSDRASIYCEDARFSLDLMVSDLPAAWDYLQQHDVDYARSYADGARSFWIRDPDGLVLEIIGL